MELIKRRKLYMEVLDSLIESILNGEFPPGSKLPSEKELMVRLGVGRPAIREAMLALQQMGLIQILHGERARVVNPTADVILGQISSAVVMMLATNSRGLSDLKEARLLIETGLARIATSKATALDLEKLTKAHSALMEARGDPAAFVSRDMAFHVLISEISGNALVATVVRGMLEWLSRFRRELVSVRGADRLTIDEHEKILKCIVGGDAEGAATAMSEHIGRANALYNKLSVQAFSSPPTST